MLGLVLALALGASTHAFVVTTQLHRPALSSCTRGQSSSPAVPVGDGPARRYSRLRRPGGYTVSPSGITKNRVSTCMRVRRPRGGDVEIEGVGGETRRVQQRSRRRPDLRQIGLQTAAAMVVQQDEVVDIVEEQAEAEGETIGEESGEEFMNLAESFDASQRLVEESMMDPQTGTIQDQYTKLYMPMDGLVIKKTYGFWTWQVFGFIFVQHFVRNLIRKGGSLKKTSMSELNWDHIVTEPEHLLELKAYCCEECGYTLFPARGRHEVFFDEVEDFKCPECYAPRSSFFDANDKNDPHNQKRLEKMAANVAGSGKADGEGGGSEDADGGSSEGEVVASAAAGAPSTVSTVETTTGAPAPAPAAPASGAPEQAPPESSAKNPAAEEANGADDDDDDDDDLLDM
ncbi:unnamed protein product [Ectocarpus sp. 12 AP-2014]